MSRRLTVELSDEVYSIIQRKAVEANVSPADVASESLDSYFHEQVGTAGTEANKNIRGKAGRHTNRNDSELQAARERFESHFGSVDLGYATGTENETIDVDLEREYANLNERA